MLLNIHYINYCFASNPQLGVLTHFSSPGLIPYSSQFYPLSLHNTEVQVILQRKITPKMRVRAVRVEN